MLFGIHLGVEPWRFEPRQTPTEMQGLRLGILPGLQATFCREQEQVKLGFRRYCARECPGNSAQNLYTASIQS